MTTLHSTEPTCIQHTLLPANLFSLLTKKIMIMLRCGHKHAALMALRLRPGNSR